MLTEPAVGTARQADATVEHVRPVSLGGADDWRNCLVACFFCNNLRPSWLPARHFFELRIGCSNAIALKKVRRLERRRAARGRRALRKAA